MKRNFLASVAILAFSGLALANNQDSKLTVLNKKESTLTNKTISTEEDEVWFCYLASTVTSPPDMAGETTTTETYNCTWYDL